MTFTSWQFGVFVAMVFAAYYLPALRSFQVQLLVFAVFGTYLFLVLALRNRQVWLPVGIVFNLALLAFFKYKLLFIDPASPSLVDFAPLDFLLKLPLPIGISFFVFHNISLLVDLTRQKAAPPTLTGVFLYIIFFPQLVSGPITRAEMFMPQIKPKYFADVPFVEALQTRDRWLLIFLYSYQIYADFFGYSAIAIGLGLLFGYRLPINFNLPYISTSFSEFWTRWHISLSTWLRTYLYVPLGGNRHGLWRTYLNLMIVMGLGGLWHGAGLSYLMWGLLHGLLLVLERPLLARLASIDFAVFRAARMTFVFFCVTMLWIFFKLPNFDHVVGYLAGMFTPSTNPNPTKLFYSLALLYSLPVMIQHLAFGSLFEGKLRRVEPYVYGSMVALMYLEAGPETSFIYFQF